MQKRNPGRGNAGASQIDDLCLGDIANPTKTNHIVNGYATNGERLTSNYASLTINFVKYFTVSG